MQTCKFKKNKFKWKDSGAVEFFEKNNVITEESLLNGQWYLLKGRMLLPNGKLVSMGYNHKHSMVCFLDSIRLDAHEENKQLLYIEDLCRQTGTIRIEGVNNALIFGIMAPVTKEQLTTIRRAFKDMPDYKIEYYIDDTKPGLVCGNNCLSLIKDLRDMVWL